jgi:hypothetical protein
VRDEEHMMLYRNPRSSRGAGIRDTAARGSSAARLPAIGLAALLLLAGPLAMPGYGQESGRGISLFPEPETERVVPKAETLPLPESVYVSGAVVANLVTFPYTEAWCAAGEILGFLVGSVARSVVWAATLGDQIESGEGFDRAGTFIVENGCRYPLFITPEKIKAGPPPAELPATASQRQ